MKPGIKIMSNKKFLSHGDGSFSPHEFASLGNNVIFEKGVLIFHPENIIIAENVYIGHNTILKAYYENKLQIGSNSWIGQACFFHSGGNIIIGEEVGIGPKVSILTSQHRPTERNKAILFSPLEFKEVRLENGCDIGVNTTILPGIIIGKGALVAAGSVVNKNIPEYEVWGGVPAKKIGER